MTGTHRILALLGVVISVAILIPGLVLPVISLRGTLDPEGISQLAPQVLEQGLTDDAVDQLRPLLNPQLVPMFDAFPGGLKQALVSQLSTQIQQGLGADTDIEVYQQTRSILGSVDHLYKVGAGVAATLILLFSVIVPFVKAVLVLVAVLLRDATKRARTTRFVETIAKWSMADVFAVALFIAYLAAQASQVPPGPGFVAQPVTFEATFGAGFYWFATYCLVSLATQQWTARRLVSGER